MQSDEVTGKPQSSSASSRVNSAMRVQSKDVNGSVFFFGFRFDSVRFADLWTDTFFELICGLIYSALIVQKSANRNIYRIEANRKTRNQSNSLRPFKCNNWAKNRTQPNRKLRVEPKFFHINTEESTEPNQKQNESLRKLYFTTQFFLHFEFRFFHRFGFGSVRRFPKRWHLYLWGNPFGETEITHLIR